MARRARPLPAQTNSDTSRWSCTSAMVPSTGLPATTSCDLRGVVVEEADEIPIRQARDEGGGLAAEPTGRDRSPRASSDQACATVRRHIDHPRLL